MRKFITSRRLLTISSVLFISGFILTAIVISCRKAAMQSVEIKADEPAIKFFTNHQSQDATIVAAENFVKQQNEKYKFLSSLTKRIGLPYWDKSMVFSRLYAAKGSSSDSVSVVYIPFARDSEKTVNATLIITMKPADTTFRFLYDWQYPEYGFDTTTNMQRWSAKDIFHIFTLFDKNIFGVNKFLITDKNLLTSLERELIRRSGLNADSVKVVRELGEERTSAGKAEGMMPIEVCTNYTICIQPCSPAQARGSLLSKAESLACCHEYGTEEICTTYYVDDGGGAPPSQPTGPGGGGGVGDPGGGWEDPCPSGPVQPRGEFIEPCGDPGWQPAPTDVENPEVFDFSNSEPSIDLQKYFNCFDHISDNGATYSIKLCTDLPVNSNPNALVTTSLTPGHAFLTLTKSNGGQSITQSFGFYPISGF